MKNFILKEYGSWSVLILSYLTGMSAGHNADFGFIHLFPLLALVLLMNSKQSLTRFLRNPSLKTPAVFFLLQMLSAGVILSVFFGTAMVRLLPLLIVPATYVFLLKYYGEHFVLTEIAGFAVLTSASLIARFAVSGVIDYRLYAAVALFFASGVFRVRAFLRKKLRERIVLAGYAALVTVLYLTMRLSPLIPLPLLDNLLYALVLYKVTLRSTGWIEAFKGIIFVVLMVCLYR